MDYPGLDEKNRLIIVSNRVPYNITRIRNELVYKKSVGGLVTALDPILRKTGGLWIGWSGLAGNSKFVEKKVNVSQETNVSYELKLVNLSHDEIIDSYRGFSNRTIWPLFHGFIFQSYFDATYWRSYQKTNRKFASEVLQEATKDDIIWVHDYHLISLASELRSRGVTQRIGSAGGLTYIIDTLSCLSCWAPSPLCWEPRIVLGAEEERCPKTTRASRGGSS